MRTIEKLSEITLLSTVDVNCWQIELRLKKLTVVVDCCLMLEIQSIKEYGYALYKRNIKEK